jgi:hypothetical protein
VSYLELNALASGKTSLHASIFREYFYNVSNSKKLRDQLDSIYGIDFIWNNEYRNPVSPESRSFVYLNLNNILFRLNRRPKIIAVRRMKGKVLLHRVPNYLFTGINQIVALLFCWIDMMKQTWLPGK